MNTPDTRPVSRHAVFACVLALHVTTAGFLLTGCGTSHSEHRMQAEQRWNSVRGRVQFQLAEKQFRGGLFEEAARTATESIALDPGHTAGYVLLARAQLELGRIASADQTVRIAEEAGLSSMNLAYTRGVILEQRADLDGALDAFARAHRISPGNVDVLIAYAEALVAKGREAEALELLDNAVDATDDPSAVLDLAAQIALLTGDHTGALDRYRRATAGRSKNDLAAENFGLLLVRAGRHQEAINYLRPLVAEDEEGSRMGSARRALAVCHLALDDPVSAKAVLIDYGKANPSDSAAQVLLAKSALASNDMLTALSATATAEQYAGQKAEVRFVRAILQWKRGELVAAEQSLRNLLAERPEDVDVHCLLGEVLLKRNDPVAARRQFERALRIDPDNPWARKALES